MKTANPGKKPPKLRQMFGSRFKAGSYSAFAAAVVIAIAVLANLAVQALPQTATQIDLTAQSLYTLSDQTRRIAASLDTDVNLYLLALRGNEDDTISRLLQSYAELNSHIHVSNVDPTEQPTFLDTYDLDINQLYANSVLVDGGGRSRLVSYSDIYVTDYSMNYSTYQYDTSTSFDGENALTNAIHYVSSQNLPKVYQLTGHGESELSDYMEELLAGDNVETETLSLLSMESVPEDASVVMINAPTSDLSADEAEMLVQYVENGGRLLLLTGYIEQGKMENLLTVTKAMGLTVGQGLIMEGDGQMHLNRYPHYLLPTLESHTITSPFTSGRYYILVPMAQPLEETEDSSAAVTWLLTTSESAYTKAAGMNATTVEKEDGDEEGQFHVAAVSELGEGRLVWIASSEFLDDNVNAMVSGANGNLLMNAVDWMAGQEETISIRSKSLDEDGLTVTGAENSLWSAVMIGILPAALIALGIVICIRRKRR